MTSYLNNGYDVMKYFAKFEKFIPYSIITPSFMTIGSQMKYFAKFGKFIHYSIIIPSFVTIGSQMPELDRGGGAFCPPPPYKIGCQNTPYKLGLSQFSLQRECLKIIKNIKAPFN